MKSALDFEIEIPIVILGGYSRNFPRRQCKNHGKGPAERIFRLSENLKSINFDSWRWNILGLLQTSGFELLGGWNVFMWSLQK